MNALDFDLRVLKPWARDPAFYQSIWTEQSDTPAHEGPTHHAVIDLWTYTFPLSAADQTRLARQLASIPPLLRQARTNLIGAAKDLWITGAGTMRQQIADLEELAKSAGGGRWGVRAGSAGGARRDRRVCRVARQAGAVEDRPVGIGKADYTWNLQNVHLVPMTWDEEVVLLKRELARAHSSLALEEQRNKGLPQLSAAATADDFARRANDAVTKYMAFLKNRDVLTVQPYLEPAMRAHIGGFVPIEQRNFFGIASHYEPMTLFAHWFHWFDHEWMKAMPHASPIRRGSRLYNIWDNRSEGMATAMEELILHAGYYDDNPRRARSCGSCLRNAARAVWRRSTRTPTNSTSSRPRRSRSSGHLEGGCGRISTCSASSSSCISASPRTDRAMSRANP
jgi:hypothetical protein